MFVCVQWCPTHIMLCFCFVSLRLVYPMLPVSLDCPFLITPSSCVPYVPYVASFSGLSVFDYPFVLLPVSLDCPFLITLSSCVPYVASFSGLSVFDYPFVLCTLCCQFLWMPVSLDCHRF